MFKLEKINNEETKIFLDDKELWVFKNVEKITDDYIWVEKN